MLKLPSLRMKGLFTKNLPLKLSSVILAGLLELYFYSPDNSLKANVQVAISLANLPERLMVVEPKGELAIDIDLEGPEPLIEKVKSEPPIISLNIPPGVRSVWDVQFSEEDLDLPLGVKATDWSPRSLRLVFEKRVKRSVPVKITSKGKDEITARRLESLVVKPEQVVVSGPESTVTEIKELLTEPLDISRLKGSYSKDLTLQEVGDGVTLNVNMVSVRLEEAPTNRKRAIEKVSIRLISPPGMLVDLKEKVATVVLTGPPADLEKLDPSQITLVADATRLGAGSHRVKIAGLLPGGYEILTTSPPEVIVRVRNIEE